MTRPSPARRSLALLSAAALALTVPSAPTAAAQDGYGPSLSQRRAAARLAQRERDAARRRRANGYTFGAIPGANVPDAALTAPRPGGDDAAEVTTRVRVVVLVDGAAGLLSARRWRDALGGLGTDVSVRTAGPRDELGVTEEAGTGLRTVTATGGLTPDGGLSFGTKRFDIGQRRELLAWVRSLQTHGAAGDPSGEPLWGLSPTTFRAVHRALAEPSPDDFAARAGGGTVGAAVAALELPAGLPVRLTAEAEAVLADPAARATDDGALPPLSKGTALAVLLARRGLAFRPARTPAGAVELTVVPRPAADPLLPAPGAEGLKADGPTAAAAAWPVGWAVADGPGRLSAAPGLFGLTTVGVRRSSLTEFAAAAAAAGGTPVVLDAAALRAAGIDPNAATAEVPRGRGSWNTALRYAFAEHRLKTELRRDEAGRGFVWVAPAR